MCGDLLGEETSVLVANDVCASDACLWRFVGVQRRLYLRRLRDLRGVVWTPVLATPVELYTYILMRRMWGAENSYVLSSHCLSLYGAIGI